MKVERTLFSRAFLRSRVNLERMLRIRKEPNEDCYCREGDPMAKVFRRMYPVLLLLRVSVTLAKSLERVMEMLAEFFSI